MRSKNSPAVTLSSTASSSVMRSRRNKRIHRRPMSASATRRLSDFTPIVAGEVRHADAPERVVKGMPRHPYRFSFWRASPCTANGKGRGIGAELLLDCPGAVHCEVADIVGMRSLAGSMQKKRFLLLRSTGTSGFVPSPTDSRHLFMLIRTFAP